MKNVKIGSPFFFFFFFFNDRTADIYGQFEGAKVHTMHIVCKDICIKY